MSMPAIFGHALAHGGAHSFCSVTNAVEQATGTVAPNGAPEIGDLIEAHQRGWISDVTLTKGCMAHCAYVDPGEQFDTTGRLSLFAGYRNMWNRVYDSKQELPGQVEYREIANRYFLTDQQMADSLQRWGYTDAALRDRVTNLRYDIPGPADLVRFSVRHCWEPDILARLGYADEFPGQIIDLWHAMKGLDYPLFTGPFESQFVTALGSGVAAEQLVQQYIAATGSEPTWARFYWYSHWVLPSPTQGYLMWQRLRPDRDVRWDGPEMIGQNFDFDSLNLLLRANDYPPYYRPLLAAISRPIPGVRYARQFAQNEVYNLDDLYQWTQRQGYSAGDGIDIANSLWADAQKAANKSTACKGCAAAIQAYEVGILDRDALVRQLVAWGATAQDAERQAAVADVDLGTRRAKEVVAAVRKQFLLGGLDDAGVGRTLLGYGIVAGRVAEYLADWQLELQFRAKQVAAGKVVKWACDGLISIDDLNRRLINMGYPDEDRAGLLAEAEQCAAQLAARAAAAQARQQQQQIRQQIQAQKQALAAVKALAQMLAGRATPKDLRKWFCEGLISSKEVYQRLAYLQWPVEDITRLIGDCKSGQKGGQGGGGATGG